MPTGSPSWKPVSWSSWAPTPNSSPRDASTANSGRPGTPERASITQQSATDRPAIAYQPGERAAQGYAAPFNKLDRRDHAPWPGQRPGRVEIAAVEVAASRPSPARRRCALWPRRPTWQCTNRSPAGSSAAPLAQFVQGDVPRPGAPPRGSRCRARARRRCAHPPGPRPAYRARATARCGPSRWPDSRRSARPCSPGPSPSRTAGRRRAPDRPGPGRSGRRPWRWR